MTTRNPTTAITIGNFDGVHLGHAALVRAARAAAEQAAGVAGGVPRVVAMVFEPHPATVLKPDRVPSRLTTFAQRRDWLTRAGADEVVALRPTRELLNQTPEEFIAGVVREYAPSFIVEGDDFRFGHGRAGSIQTLRQLEHQYSYRTITVDAVQVALSDQSLVRATSSTMRWLLEHGRVRDAAALLGRPYEVIAQVVQGDKRGRTIGMPTANLGPIETMLPADGIYAGVGVVSKVQNPKSQSPKEDAASTVAALDLGLSFPAAISIGTKPTFGEHPRTCEAHLIGYDGPLDEYGWTIRLQFTDWLRDQLTYTNVDLLIDQLKRDVKYVKVQNPKDQSPKSTPPTPLDFATLDFGLSGT